MHPPFYMRKDVSYVQMHEFEGPVFSDMSAFSDWVDAPLESVDLLRGIRSGFATPKDINDNKCTGLRRHIKGYRPDPCRNTR